METQIEYDRRAGPQKRGTLSKVANVATNILFGCVVALMLFLVVFLVQGGLGGGPPQVFGHRLYIVASGSMNPAFDAGSVVAVRPVDPATLGAGDIISFQTREGGMPTTHRIVEVNTADGLSFTTKGDANENVDAAPVLAQNVIGRVSLAVPYAGYVVNFARTLPGLLALVVIPGALIIVFEVRNLFACAREMDRKKALAREAGGTGADRANQREAV